MEYNVMLTTIGAPGQRRLRRYFQHKDNDMMWYCDGMSVAESGTKYILSKVSIDEIIVLGPANSYTEKEGNDPVSLMGWMNFRPDNIKDMSEYSFFLYRISQFLSGLDLESEELMDLISPEKQKEVLERYQAFCDQLSKEVMYYRPDRVFNYVASDREVFKRMMKELNGLSNRELAWLKWYMYAEQLNSGFKLKPLIANEDLTVRLIPTSNEAGEYTPGRSVGHVVRALLSSEADTVNLYMDMQGIEQSDGYMILSVLSMLSNDKNSPIQIREIITTHDFDFFVNPIDNREMERYKINNLMSGMDAFIRYGKVDEIQSYWQNMGIESKHVNNLLYAMRRVDEGISFCNVGDLEYGIRLLKKYLFEAHENELPETEDQIFTIMERSIRNDYGPILDGDEPDELELVKWALRKNLYQQALTMIEARFPSAFVSRGIFYYAVDEESKNKFLESVNKSYWQDSPKDRWKYNDVSHFFIRYYGKTLMQRSFGGNKMSFLEFRLNALDENADTPLCRAYSVLDQKRDLLKNMLTMYSDLGYFRNMMNHAESKPQVTDEEEDTGENETMLRVIKAINDFLASYERVRKYIDENVGKEFPQVLVTGKELLDYTSAHRLEPEKKGGFHRDFGHDRRNDGGGFHKPEEHIGEQTEQTGEAAPKTDENRPAAEHKDVQTRHFESRKTDTFESSRDGAVTVTRTRKSDGKQFRITITIDEEGEGQK